MLYAMVQRLAYNALGVHAGTYDVGSCAISGLVHGTCWYYVWYIHCMGSSYRWEDCAMLLRRVAGEREPAFRLGSEAPRVRASRALGVYCCSAAKEAQWAVEGALRQEGYVSRATWRWTLSRLRPSGPWRALCAGDHEVAESSGELGMWDFD